VSKLKFKPFSSDHKPFDNNDPHTAIAERERKDILDRLLMAITMTADRELSALQFSGTLMGNMTGCAQGVIAHFKGDRTELETAFLAVAQEAFWMGWSQNEENT
jgi:hypothetical protein